MNNHTSSIIVALALSVAACVPFGTSSARREAKQSCGNPQVAYEHGYNAAKNGEDLRTDWSDRCAPPDRAAARDAYSRGYQDAANRVVVIGRPVPQQCEVNSDGSKTCGYNCELGSRGSYYCASRPDAHCEVESDGSFSCP